MSLQEWLEGYCEDVINDEVVSCQKHKWACQRFLNDIKKQNKKSFPYKFDEERAFKFLKWMTYFKHRKGVLAGKPIDPHPIQIFIFSNIYGWIHKETGYRRFRKAYWGVGRKNAKSQSLAMVGTYEAFAMNEPSAEIYCAATKTDQSKIVWEEAEWLVRNCEHLKEKYKISYGRINHLKSGSYIKALSKEDRKTGDGLNPHCGIIDEYHAHETTEIYDIIGSGMGARKQPLIIIITTAGYELSKPCYSIEYKYVSQILDPNNPIENEEYFVMVNELDKDDDVKDEAVWEKANPIAASYEEGLSYLRGELKAALDAPEKMRTFLTKNMNKWVEIREGGYMDMDKWSRCGADVLPDLEGKECYVGIDLSSKIDLTSVSFIFPIENKFIILSHSFMPEDTLERKMRTDKVPYDLWVKEGWITITDGEVVDYQYIQEYVKEIAEQEGWVILEIDYDPYNATQFAQIMEEDGYTPVEIRQGVKTLGEPTKCFRENVYSQNVAHNKNPVLTWAMGNAVVRQDHNDNIMLDKKKSTDRIDPAVAVINAYTRARLVEDHSSVYDGRGILSI